MTGGVSSARYPQLRLYRDEGLGQVREWKRQAARIGEVLRRLGLELNDLEGAGPLAIVDPSGRFESLARRQEHLDEWVGKVGDKFSQADHRTSTALGVSPETLDPSQDPSRVISLDDSAIDVGPADLAAVREYERQRARERQLERRAGEDAAELRRLLDEAGVLDHWNAYLSPDAPNHARILDLLKRAGGNMANPVYAGRFYDTLGVSGTRGIAGVLDSLQELETMEPAEVRALADPLIEGFARATDSLEPAFLTGLLELGEDRNQRGANERHVGILLTAEGGLYDPVFLADAADSVFFDQGVQVMPHFPQAAAMRALAENAEASWVFASKGDAQVEMLFYPPVTDNLYHQLPQYTVGWLDTPVHELDELYELWSAATYFNAMGVPIKYKDPDTGLELDWRDGASIGVGFIPFVGTGQSAVELASGKDHITGESVNRWLAGTGLIAGMIPGGKGSLKAIGKFFSRLFVRGVRRAPIPHNLKPPDTPPTRSSRIAGAEPFPNLQRWRHADDVADMNRAGVTPTEPGSRAFDEMLNASDDRTLIYVVRQDGSLVVAPRNVGDIYIKHGALTRSPDERVLAAGEMKVVGRNGDYRGLIIDNSSGHFQPRNPSMDIATAIFEDYGIIFERVERVGS